MTSTGQRRLDVPGTFNLRDLGGYPTGDGGSLRWRTLLRSDALHLVGGPGRAVFGGLGLRTVVDLRTQLEADIAPSALDGLGIRTCHVPLLAGDLDALPAAIGDIYDHMVDSCGAQMAAAVAVLAEPDALPALIHCSAGKDRTGVLVALLLAAIGVPDAVIAADYAMSQSYLLATHTKALRQLRASTGMGQRLTAQMMDAPTGLILGTLARARTRAGSAAGYLTGHGLAAAALARLRAALVEYPEPAAAAGVS